MILLQETGFKFPTIFSSTCACADVFPRCLTVQNMLLYRDAQMAYKIMNGSVPFYLSGLLMRRSSIHCFNTRNRQDLNVPKCRKSLAKSSFRYRAAKLWNAIPSKVKDSPTLNSFKRSIKNWLLMDNDSII